MLRAATMTVETIWRTLPMRSKKEKVRPTRRKPLVKKNPRTLQQLVVTPLREILSIRRARMKVQQ